MQTLPWNPLLERMEENVNLLISCQTEEELWNQWYRLSIYAFWDPSVSPSLSLQIQDLLTLCKKFMDYSRQNPPFSPLLFRIMLNEYDPQKGDVRNYWNHFLKGQ